MHITIDVLHSTNLESHVTDCPELCRLKFIMCQLENYNIQKKRRRYYVITQILALKAHLISPTCYRYLFIISLSLTLIHWTNLLFIGTRTLVYYISCEGNFRL